MKLRDICMVFSKLLHEDIRKMEREYFAPHFWDKYAGKGEMVNIKFKGKERTKQLLSLLLFGEVRIWYSPSKEDNLNLV